MADDDSNKPVGGVDTKKPGDLAPGDPGTGVVTRGNAPSADKGAPEVEADPLAYRNKGENGRLRAEHLERVIIENFYGGQTRRFDDAAGLDYDA